MKKFTSSNVKSGSYDPETETLSITFKGNRTYEYSEVEKNRWRGLLRSVSKGHYVNAKIGYSYPYTRLT